MGDWLGAIKKKEKQITTFKPKLISRQGSHTFELSLFHDFQFTICTPSMIHLLCLPNFCITFAIHFSWIWQSSRQKLKTFPMQNCGGWEDQGVLRQMCKWPMTFSLFPQNFLSVTFETIQNVLGIFYLTSSNSVQQTQTRVRALKLLVFISYLVLALTSAVTNLPNIS